MSARVPDHLRKRAPGAGRKPADYVPPQSKVDFDFERARNERAKANINELEFAVKKGTFVARAAVGEAAATALAALSQTLRSIPDLIERKLGVAPEVAQEVGDVVDAALNEVAQQFEDLYAEAQEEVAAEEPSDLDGE